LNALAPSSSQPDDLISSYAALALSLVPELAGISILDAGLTSRGEACDFVGSAPIAWIHQLQWLPLQCRMPASHDTQAGSWTALPIEQSDGTLLGVFCTSERPRSAGDAAERRAAELARRLKPLLACVHRDLAAAKRADAQVQALTERTAELEWLFTVTSKPKSGIDEQGAIEALLRAATERLGCALGVLSVPDRRLMLSYQTDRVAAAHLA
jgi:hypothetical protein